jgi:tetratricopeptide (TPR) repeat protein
MDAREHFLHASELASAGEVDRAETSFANAVLLAPAWSIARYQLGLLQFSSGRAAAALVTWGPLVELPDADPLSHFVRGFAALASDSFDEAKRHFHTGLACDIDNVALAGDIEKVLAQLDAVAHAPAQAQPAAPDVPHVLLSNYGRIGNLH